MVLHREDKGWAVKRARQSKRFDALDLDQIMSDRSIFRPIFTVSPEPTVKIGYFSVDNQCSLKQN